MQPKIVAERQEDMRGGWLFVSVGVVSAVAFGACQDTSLDPVQAGHSLRTPSASAAMPTPTPKESKTWRKPRFISVVEAVERLRPHIDVPVVLPDPRSAYLPNFKGWLTDPKYLDWGRVDGVRVGTMTLIKGRRRLIISYGLGGFDGCGGRETAIETTVLGQPALVKQASKDLWSDIIWPVTPMGSTGRYGISGTFDGSQAVRLAESMEAARLGAIDDKRGC